MEIKSREFEYRRRLELSRIEVIEAKDTAELAEFEAPMAKQELTELLQDANERTVSPAAVLQVNTKVDKDVKRSLQPLLEEIEQRQYSIKICLRLQVVIFLIDAPTQRYPTQQQTNLLSPFGSTALLNTLVATMEKTGISHDLPAVEIQKFDGSPQSFPIFRQRFYHMIQSKPIDEDVAPFSVLEGPPLEAVKRYEIVTDDITWEFALLDHRYGWPCQIMRACVDSLTKGPIMASNNIKEELQKFADEAHVMFDIL